MPELPEVETVRRQLADALVGRTVERVTLRRADIVRGAAPRRFARPCAAGRLRRSTGVQALIVRLSDDVVLLVHLGMSGRFA